MRNLHAAAPPLFAQPLSQGAAKTGESSQPLRKHLNQNAFSGRIDPF